MSDNCTGTPYNSVKVPFNECKGILNMDLLYYWMYFTNSTFIKEEAGTLTTMDSKLGNNYSYPETKNIS